GVSGTTRTRPGPVATGNVAIPSRHAPTGVHAAPVHMAAVTMEQSVWWLSDQIVECSPLAIVTFTVAAVPYVVWSVDTVTRPAVTGPGVPRLEEAEPEAPGVAVAAVADPTVSVGAPPTDACPQPPNRNATARTVALRTGAPERRRVRVIADRLP